MAPKEEPDPFTDMIEDPVFGGRSPWDKGRYAFSSIGLWRFIYPMVIGMFALPATLIVLSIEGLPGWGAIAIVGAAFVIGGYTAHRAMKFISPGNDG